MHKLKFIIALVLLLFHVSAMAFDCLSDVISHIPILADGRVKPLNVHAKELIKKSFRSDCPLKPEIIYCQLSLLNFVDQNNSKDCEVKLPVDHKQLKHLLSINKQEAVTVDVVEKNMFSLKTELSNETARGHGESGYALAISRLLLSYQNYQQITLGQDWKILIAKDQWVSLFDILKQNPQTDLTAVLKNQIQFLNASESAKLENELLYERLNLFLVSLVLAIVGFILGVSSMKISKFFIGAKVTAIILLLSLLLSMGLRILISGRAPVTNMFETVLWTAIGVLVFGVFLSQIKKDPLYLVISFSGNVIMLFMMKFATGMLDSSIRPLVPVLRDNFWLSTHVTTITLSYACFALSWFIANFILVGELFSKVKSKMLENLNDAIRLIIQIGSVLLAAGIILGGIWADYSWGRFWGWDPKETWSLIALIIYMAILHGKYAGWFRGIQFTLVNALGFQFVLMAWFGVNYILASGLHSYGFSKGGTVFLVSIFITQISLILLVLLKQKIFKFKSH